MHTSIIILVLLYMLTSISQRNKYSWRPHSRMQTLSAIFPVVHPHMQLYARTHHMNEHKMKVVKNWKFYCIVHLVHIVVTLNNIKKHALSNIKTHDQFDSGAFFVSELTIRPMTTRSRTGIHCIYAEYFRWQILINQLLSESDSKFKVMNIHALPTSLPLLKKEYILSLFIEYLHTILVYWSALYGSTVW